MTNIPHTRTTVQAPALPRLPDPQRADRESLRFAHDCLEVLEIGDDALGVGFQVFALGGDVDATAMGAERRGVRRERAHFRRWLVAVARVQFERRAARRASKARPRAPRSARVRRAARRVDCDVGGDGSDPPPEPPAPSADRDGGADA